MLLKACRKVGYPMTSREGSSREAGSCDIDPGAYERDVILDFRRLGKTTANTLHGALDSMPRRGCHFAHWFPSL